MNSNRLEATLEGARSLYYLDPKSLNTALSLVTSLDNKFVDVNIEVSIILFYFFFFYKVCFKQVFFFYIIIVSFEAANL